MGLIDYFDEGGSLSTLGSEDDESDTDTPTKPTRSTSSIRMVLKDVSGRLSMLFLKCRAGGIHHKVFRQRPGIADFQIIGDANPGTKIMGCGYSTNGTTTCYFQWVRCLEDGIRHYVEGATDPEYIVTADDVDKVIALECIPLDVHGHKGTLIRCFANDQKKISCDPDMQAEIDSYVSKGQADFNVLLMSDSFECWREATFILRQSDFQVKINKTETIQLTEKLSDNSLIKIPSWFFTQFVLSRSDGTSHHIMCFNTCNDFRTRDTLVLTVRMFQSKVLDDSRKK